METESIQNIIHSVTSYTGVIKFIEGGELKKILSTIGGVEFNAAQDAFSQFKTARNKRDLVLSAINHLRTAHHAFK